MPRRNSTKGPETTKEQRVDGLLDQIERERRELVEFAEQMDAHMRDMNWVLLSFFSPAQVLHTFWKRMTFRAWVRSCLRRLAETEKAALALKGP